ncbi:CGNR zinc finger domain-containing protein [Streptomyces tauricus]|uniref:CGNR zinc finger domain-containing protein n=1 Tax=Streptomyces tauricus TaxID=68274 RepID=UPI002242EB21|nr:CGNR zinc finger domain-containing protein [Streptomyces tauricus]MCW8101660.1 CGNR zinc finger domain-containing protein [Streptomyces tauricus]
MNRDDSPRSTGRLLLAAAPGGLCVVQDLLNTAGMPAASLPDLLADETSACNWLDVSLRTWSEQTGRDAPRITVSGDDLPALRDLRGLVRGWLTGGAENDAPHPLRVGVSYRDGRLAYEPSGDGAAAVASLVHLEALLASHTGALVRLKACRNPACGAAFYDLSRNGTRVWHDMKTCGNTMNLRASRARRQASPKPADQTPHR